MVIAGAAVCASSPRSLRHRPGARRLRLVSRRRAPHRRAEGQPGAARSAQNPTTFFVTSVGKGDGANYGGLAGADAYCAQLAQAANVPRSPAAAWRAYLSAQGRQRPAVVNARDRIGAGPWHNARAAQLIAINVADLHGDVQRDRNTINKQQALSEKGQPRFPAPATRPTSTTSSPAPTRTGARCAGEMDTTCGNYTRNTDGERQRDGRAPRPDRRGNTSWNSAHRSRGCSQPNRWPPAGRDCFYCFAAN